VIVALELLVRAAVVTLKFVDVAAAAIVTEAGTVNFELEFESVTLAPPVGADLVNVTVQVLDEFGPRLVGVHANDDTSTDVVRPTAVVAELLL
jgi:orotidine-5'-phosphate decarboxylase